jgi:hypothetical protein
MIIRANMALIIPVISATSRIREKEAPELEPRVQRCEQCTKEAATDPSPSPAIKPRPASE